MNSINKIFSIASDEDFEKVALEVYAYQIEHCKVYRDFVHQLNWKTPTSIKEIPFLPIEFFKTHSIISKEKESQQVFKSSGTGGIKSSHLVADLKLYEASFDYHYQNQIGNPKEQVILALLPNYLEQGESSLVYMVNHLIEQTDNSLSGFILGEEDALLDSYQKALKEDKQVVIFGVSYALLDLAEKKVDLSRATIIETGGMKGRRKEMTKNEMHAVLKAGLNCPNISSEYGMTELLSQAYSKENGLFKDSSILKVLIRETNDPFSYCLNGKTGGINVIDLANIYSCSFIATQDLGKRVTGGFEILGRFDNSDVRGCNLLIG
ncbi:MAG TPA: acyl transferase [Crocinitomicaceae bacterium]|nr:acyl transferase [Crocinitomicaceae bacterium]